MDNQSAFCAEEYDEKICRTLPYYEDIYDQIVDLIGAFGKKDIKWLDVGCGTGKMAEVVQNRLSVKRLVLCDRSDKMLSIAKVKLASYSGTMEFVNCSAQGLTYDNTFDVVTAVQVNHYMNWKNRVLSIQNCYNTLDENGIYITFENVAPFSEIGKDVSLKRWKRYQINKGLSEKESEKHIQRYGKEYFPITIAEHLEIMRNIGFKAVEIFWLSYMQIGLWGIK